MSHLGSTVPYYGGGQVVNPANVTQIYSDPPTFKASLGSLAVNSTAQTAYIAIAEDGPGNRTVWADIFTNASKDAFPITPYVVGPSPHAGYQTIQSALNAANLDGGGVVYIQPGTYTENLLWPTGISLVCTQSTSFFSQVNIIGQHTILAGRSASRQFGASKIQFQSNGNLFSGPISDALSASLTECICRVQGDASYIFNFPNISSDLSNVFQIVNCTILSGGTISTAAAVTLTVIESTLSATPDGVLTNNGGTWLFRNCIVSEPIQGNSGTIGASSTVFYQPMVLGTASTLSLLNCSFFTDRFSCLICNDQCRVDAVGCNFTTLATPVIDGNSVGTLYFENSTFFPSVSINPALNSNVSSSLLIGPIVCGTTQPDLRAYCTIAVETDAQQRWGVHTTGNFNVDQNQLVFFDNSIMAPSANVGFVGCYDTNTRFYMPSGITVPLAFSFYAGPFFDQNQGTITTFANFYSETFFGPLTGTLTNAYGAYLKNPGIGTNQCALFADNFAIGYEGRTVPNGGGIMPGPFSIGSSAQDASAILKIASTTQGVLFPNMTTTQKLAIATPAAGLQVYDTTLNQMSYYNGTTWINF